MVTSEEPASKSVEFPNIAALRSLQCALCEYLVTNWWSGLPAAVALIVLALARQAIVLPTDCQSNSIFFGQPKAGITRGNPLLCADSATIQQIFDAGRNRLIQLRSQSSTPAPATATAAERARAAAIASVEAKAESDRLTVVLLQTQARDPSLSIVQGKEAAALIDTANKQQTATLALEKARTAGEAHLTAIREAQARLLWIDTLGISLIASIGTILGSGWITLSSGDDHLKSGVKDEGSHLNRRLAGLILLMAISAVSLILTWLVVYNLLRHTIFNGVMVPPAISSKGLLAFDDSITDYVFGNHGYAGLLPGGFMLVRSYDATVFWSIIALTSAVTTALYQRPEQVTIRRHTSGGPDVAQASAYNRFLARCFQRLNSCIYMGATLMVACVVHVSAQYNWVSALFDPMAGEEPFKTFLPAAFSALTGELSFDYGIILTALLVSLFLPAWLILRSRAWEAARSQNPDNAVTVVLQAWLDSQGMSFQAFQQYGQILTLLAPAGAGVFGTFLTSFTRG